MNWFDKSSPALFGTEYGGWTLPSHIFERLKNIILLSCGVGEDISFDHEIVHRSDWHVVLVDPTPRSKVHYLFYLKSMTTGINYSINNSRNTFYPHSDKNIDYSDRYTYLPYALVGGAEYTPTIAMHEPRVAAHVSHSAVNRLNTEIGFYAPAMDLKKLLDYTGNPVVWAIKMDIEGSEWKVTDDILSIRKDRLPAFVCIEVHKLSDHTDYKSAVNNLIQLYENAGYILYNRKGDDITFIKKDIL